jgi:hypothetical protein
MVQFSLVVEQEVRLRSGIFPTVADQVNSQFFFQPAFWGTDPTLPTPGNKQKT